jgi:hypothetical protein
VINPAFDLPNFRFGFIFAFAGKKNWGGWAYRNHQ